MDYEKDISNIHKQLNHINSLLDNRRIVDLVSFGDLKFFFYVSDASYQAVPSSLRNYKLTEQDIKTIEQKAFKTPRLTQLHSAHDITTMLLTHYWKYRLDFSYIDIGSPYGVSAINAANLIASGNHNNTVICFEPGLTKELIPKNIRLNGFTDQIVFEPIAVSNHSLPTIMSALLNHSEADRIVNRKLEYEDFSFVVDSITLDEYITRNKIENHFIIKIDTEGAEYEIFLGMKKILRDRFVTCVWEFSPSFLSTRINPTDFLIELCKDSHLFDLGQDHSSKLEISFISPVRYGDFAEKTRKRVNMWTDILVIPNKLPGIEGLILSLTNNQINKATYLSPKDQLKTLFIRGAYDDGNDSCWMSKTAEIGLRTGPEGKLLLEGFIPREIFDNIYERSISISIFNSTNLLTSKHFDTSKVSLECELPKDSELILAIEIDKSFVPSKIGPSKDERELSIMITRITVM